MWRDSGDAGADFKGASQKVTRKWVDKAYLGDWLKGAILANMRQQPSALQGHASFVGVHAGLHGYTPVALGCGELKGRGPVVCGGQPSTGQAPRGDRLRGRALLLEADGFRC